MTTNLRSLYDTYCDPKAGIDDRDGCQNELLAVSLRWGGGLGLGEAGGVVRRRSDGVGQEVSAPRVRECEL